MAPFRQPKVACAFAVCRTKRGAGFLPKSATGFTSPNGSSPERHPANRQEGGQPNRQEGGHPNRQEGVQPNRQEGGQPNRQEGVLRPNSQERDDPLPNCLEAPPRRQTVEMGGKRKRARASRGQTDETGAEANETDKGGCPAAKLPNRQECPLKWTRWGRSAIGGGACSSNFRSGFLDKPGTSFRPQNRKFGRPFSQGIRRASFGGQMERQRAKG
jgi:hypothetical protein